MDTSSIGFNSDVKSKTELNVGEAFKHALPQDFVKFGLIPEFIGRVPITVSLEALDRDALIRILKEPKNSLIKQYTKLFELDGVGLEFTDDAVNAIADKALERKTGARGLRAIMEAVMLDLMYRIPSDKSISKCVIDKDTVEENLKLDGECVPEIYRGKSGIISTWRYFTKDTASDNINCTAVCYAWLCNNTGDISGRTDYEYACSSAERAYYSAGDDCPFRHQQRALPSCCRGGYGAGSKDLSCHTKECGQ